MQTSFSLCIFLFTHLLFVDLDFTARYFLWERVPADTGHGHNSRRTHHRTSISSRYLSTLEIAEGFRQGCHQLSSITQFAWMCYFYVVLEEDLEPHFFWVEISGLLQVPICISIGVPQGPPPFYQDPQFISNGHYGAWRPPYPPAGPFAPVCSYLVPQGS